MRDKRLKLMVMLLLGLGLTELQAQTIYINESIGTQTDYALSNVQKITFSTGNLTVIKTDNSIGVYALSDLRSLNFTDVTSSIDGSLFVQEQKLIAYPNPASEVLNINLSGIDQGEGTVNLFNFEGKTVFSRHAINTDVLSIDISHLPKGIYICTYNNTTEVKTVKIIKL